MKKLIVTVAVLIFAGISFFMSDYFRQTDDSGTITIILIDQIDDTIINEEISFEEGDTFFEVLMENYDLRCANSSYQPVVCTEDSLMGNVILVFDDVETDWNNSYIAIYIDDEYSTYGIDNIPLEDESIYRFEYALVEEAFE